MKVVLIIIVSLIVILGIVFIVVVCEKFSDVLGFLLFGLMVIVVVIIYIVGSKFYGYMGLGDILVLVFFGWLSVVGIYYF